tara:strand:- start:32 stop:214 length:183 start_codon:yes stop_codon:yes gene_type:complete
MSKTILITETRLETVNYFYEFEGTIDQAKEWFQDNGNYSFIDSDLVHSDVESVEYKEYSQ